MCGWKGRRGPAERLLIFTTRIRVKNRMVAINRRRGRFFNINRYVSDEEGVGFRERKFKVGREKGVGIEIRRIDENIISRGRLMVVGWLGARAAK